jgi:nitroimidazol reductase NimA-like FMN-containing flavoprotein (pyridoxamine 5'-phosphate oxidase superfamily)
MTSLSDWPGAVTIDPRAARDLIAAVPPILGTAASGRRIGLPGGPYDRDIEGTTDLDAQTCLELLRTCDVGRLAVSISDHPDIFPINYVVDRGMIVFRTSEGTKLAAALLGRAVAFEVDGYDRGAGEAWSVVVKGHANEIESMDAYFDALDLPLFPWHAGPKHRFVCIEPIAITGRRFKVVGREGATPNDDR